MKTRIKYLRKNILKLTQLEFGTRLGLTESMISRIENGSADLTERNINLICKIFGIDYFWLTEGIGEAKIETKESIVDEVVLEYGLNENSKAIIMAYLEMDDQGRKAIEDYFLKIAEKLKEEK